MSSKSLLSYNIYIKHQYKHFKFIELMEGRNARM